MSRLTHIEQHIIDSPSIPKSARAQMIEAQESLTPSHPALLTPSKPRPYVEGYRGILPKASPKAIPPVKAMSPLNREGYTLNDGELTPSAKALLNRHNAAAELDAKFENYEAKNNEFMLQQELNRPEPNLLEPPTSELTKSKYQKTSEFTKSRTRTPADEYALQKATAAAEFDRRQNQTGGPVNLGGRPGGRDDEARYFDTKTTKAGAVDSFPIVGAIAGGTIGTSIGLGAARDNLSQIPVLGRALDVGKDIFDWTTNPLTGGIITAAPYIGYRLGREALDAAGILKKSDANLTADPVSLTAEFAKAVGKPANPPTVGDTRGSKRAMLDEPPTRSLRAKV